MSPRSGDGRSRMMKQLREGRAAVASWKFILWKPHDPYMPLKEVSWTVATRARFRCPKKLRRALRGKPRPAQPPRSRDVGTGDGRRRNARAARIITPLLSRWMRRSGAVLPGARRDRPGPDRTLVAFTTRIPATLVGCASYVDPRLAARSAGVPCRVPMVVRWPGPRAAGLVYRPFSCVHTTWGIPMWPPTPARAPMPYRRWRLAGRPLFADSTSEVIGANDILCAYYRRSEYLYTQRIAITDRFRKLRIQWVRLTTRCTTWNAIPTGMRNVARQADYDVTPAI